MSISEPLDNPVGKAKEEPQARPSLLAALKVRDFRLVWFGESISLLGDQFYMIALPWLTLQLTGSGLALGAVAAAGGIPRAVFMLLGGAITDRFSPRSVMFISNALRVVLTVLMTILVLTNNIQFWMLFVSALVFGLVDAFFFPAQSAVVPQIVSPEQIESGNALMQITGQLANFVGPALAGLIIAVMTGANNAENVQAGTGGIGLAIALDSLTFIVAAIALWMMQGGRGVQKKNDEPQTSILASIGEGLRLVWNDTRLRTLVLLVAAINFFVTGPMGVGIPVLANSHFAEGAAALGAILSSFGGGALVGALLGGSLPAPKQLGVIAMLSITVIGIAVALYGLVNSLILAVGAGLLMGVAIGYVNVVMISWMQKRTAPELLGRVMSLIMLASFGLGPISNLVAGALVDVNLPLLFIGAGGALVILSLLALTNKDVRSIGQ